MSTAAGASAPAAAAEAAPTRAQLLFARALILTFELWPAMRLAVAEQWGGPESAAKRDYLISHLADEYGGATGAVGSVAEAKAAAAAAATASASSGTQPLPPPESPDRDDIADLMDGYINDEFEVRLEDGTSDWVAGRITELHRQIFYGETVEEGRSAVQALEEACAKLRGSKTQVQKGAEEDFSGSDDDDDEDEDDDEDGMEVDGQQQQPRQPRARPQPEVDEDGFTTVVRRR